MKIKDVHFLKSCVDIKEFPDQGHPEIAFLGRSNVGKSSLINMLVNKKNLVKTGSKPGVTKTVNFFILNSAISIADLPGFGYANVPIKLKKTFLPLIRKYIMNRGNLKLAFLLIDIRRTPDRMELDLMRLLSGNKIPVAVTLTKCDKVSRNNLARQIKVISGELGLDGDSLFATSAKTRLGRNELLGLIAEYSARSDRNRD
jgi:GTP-binding protein